MNAVRYPTPAERSDVVRSVPDPVAQLTEARRDLAAHYSRRPGTADLNARAAWVEEKDRLLLRVQILEGQLANRWHPVRRIS